MGRKIRRRRKASLGQTVCGNKNLNHHLLELKQSLDEVSVLLKGLGKKNEKM